MDRGAGEGVKVLLFKRDDDPSSHQPNGKQPGERQMPLSAEDIAAISKSMGDTITTAVTAATAPLTETIGVLKRDIVVLKMSSTHKAFMDQCGDDNAKKSFADMSDADRDKFMEKNPVKKAHTPLTEAPTLDELTKRDPAVAALVKRVDDQGAIIAEMTVSKKLATFTKQAADLGATEATDGALMMKAFSGDEPAQVEWNKRLVTINKALTEQVRVGKLFGENGTTVAKTGKAFDQLTGLAAELRKTETKLSKEQAFAKVYTDPANLELKNQYLVESNSPVA